MLLHLVRHGAPAVDPARAPSTWGLAVEADGDIRALAASGVLPSGGRWFSSPEPKALQTARRLQDEVTVLEDLAEARREAGWLPKEEFAAAVMAAFLEPDRPGATGWEPLASTRERVVTAALLARDSAAEVGRDVVLVGHGTAWTLLVAHLTGEAPDLEAWGRLTMPDHWAFDLSTGSVVSDWGAWHLR